MRSVKGLLLENKVLLVVLFLIVVFGYVDAMQIVAWHSLDSDVAWGLYNQSVAPAFRISWILSLAAIAFVWYLVRKDKSEAFGVFAAAYIFLAFGLQDVFFFVFSDSFLTACMSWFDYLPYTFFNSLMGISCTSPFVLFGSSIIGFFAGLFVFDYLKRRF